MIEMRAAEVEAVAAEEFEAGVAHGIAKLTANGLWSSLWRARRGE